MPTANSQLQTAKKSKALLLQTQPPILISPSLPKTQCHTPNNTRNISLQCLRQFTRSPPCSLRFGYYAVDHCRYKMPPQKQSRVKGQLGLIVSLKRNATLKTSCPPFLQCNGSSENLANVRKLWFDWKITIREWPSTAKPKRELELRVGWVGRYSL